MFKVNIAERNSDHLRRMDLQYVAAFSQLIVECEFGIMANNLKFL